MDVSCHQRLPEVLSVPFSRHFISEFVFTEREAMGKCLAAGFGKESVEKDCVHLSPSVDNLHRA